MSRRRKLQKIKTAKVLEMARTKKKGLGGKKSKAMTRNDVMQVGDSSNVTPPQQPTKVWQPGVDGMEDGEELQFDPTAYDCLHAFHLGWPCLSFDIMQDTQGVLRTDFPHSLFCVAGTQADQPANNAVAVMKTWRLTPTRSLNPKSLYCRFG
ncbi:unnamed protein product [Sphagnum troendelagicum]